MCGIVGYVGPRVAQDFLLEGLRRLEYRGYDSAGTATMTRDNDIKVTKSVGRIATLAQEVAADPCDSGIGIGHTRWATHGAATKSNAHPHIGGEKVLAMAHNGVIENFAELRSMLKSKGYEFKSETDTEVVAHLIADTYENKCKASGVKESHEVAIEAIKETCPSCAGRSGWRLFSKNGPTRFSPPAWAALW